MKEKKNTEFSKVLLKQESALIWILSISYVILAFYCIYMGFTGSLPWLAAMVGFPWTAYGVSQAFYYRKSMAENTKDGVKFESVLFEAQKVASQYNNANSFNYDVYENVNVNNSYTVFTNNADDYQI